MISEQKVFLPKEISIGDYTYPLPPEKIAKHPLPERDASKLLIYKNSLIKDEHFINITKYLPEQSALYFNHTKVVNARLQFTKITGGKIEIFCLEPDERYSDITFALNQKKQVYWNCLVGGVAKWKDGKKIFNNTTSSKNLTASLIEIRENSCLILFEWEGNDTFATILHHIGELPIPPYLKRKTEQDDIERYQTIFAQYEGSVAAPTASLHFTDYVIDRIKHSNCSINQITLHVGAGTFMPVKAAQMRDHMMHAEHFVVELNQLKRLLVQLKNKQTIIATGTTTARTLESIYWLGYHLTLNSNTPIQSILHQWVGYENKESISASDSIQSLLSYFENNGIQQIELATQILITPGYQFKIIDGLITNFHQPQSTLLLLIAALVGDDWKKIYEYALSNNYRFLSYGDSSLLWKK